MNSMSLLILGATGTLGRQIVKRALNEGFQVRCFVRNFRKAAFLKEWGAELIYGDLTLPETIPMTLYGVTAIIDACTTRPNDLNSVTKIDLYGKLILIESAIKANIKHYIFFSILNSNKYPNIPLIRLKLLIEYRLKQSNIAYSIFNLAGFFQGIIPQYALPILDKQSVWITGESTPIPYINTQDIAKIVIKSLSIQQLANKTFPIVGSRSWTSSQIIQICEKISGQRARITRIPLSILQLMKIITRFFEWSWNISERLSFIEVLSQGDTFNYSPKYLYNVLNINTEDIESLEVYLQEYFEKIMKKLKELNSQQVITNSTNIGDF